LWHLSRRFLDAAELQEDRRPGPLVSLRDGVVFAAYNTYTSVEPLRKLAGANADTGYNPRVRASWLYLTSEQRGGKLYIQKGRVPSSGTCCPPSQMALL